MIIEYLQKVIDNQDLTFEESFEAMSEIMNGSVNNSHLAGLLIALKSKGESPAEVAGFAKAMQEKSIKINCGDENVKGPSILKTVFIPSSFLTGAAYFIAGW